MTVRNRTDNPLPAPPGRAQGRTAQAGERSGLAALIGSARTALSCGRPRQARCPNAKSNEASNNKN